jgi:DNA-binding NarL/FixJ family response regulator
MNSQQSIGLLIVDDQPIVIEGLTSAFHAMTPHIDTLSAGSIEDAISNFRNASHLSLILSDFTLLTAGGASCIESLKSEIAAVPVVVFSSNESPELIQRVFDAGAQGFVSKRSPVPVVLGALQLVLAGGTYIPPQILSIVRKKSTESLDPCAVTKSDRVQDAVNLTGRQMEVLNLLIEGKATKNICRELNISEGTAKAHITAIFRALKIARRAQVSVAIGHQRMISAQAADMPRPDPTRSARSRCGG